MDPAPHPTWIDAVIDALSEQDAEGALLLYYRGSGKSLDVAWRELQELRVDLGEDRKKSPETAGKDPSFVAVRRYLAHPGSASKPWKETLLAGLMIMVLLIVAAWLLIPNAIQLTTSIRSFAWPTTVATVLDSRIYSESYTRRSTKYSRDYMDVLFRYQVAGRHYTRQLTRVQYYDTFGEQPLKPGETFSICYDPDQPSQTIYERKIYDRLLGIALGLICLAGVFVIGAASWSVKRVQRRLQQLDPAPPDCRNAGD